MKYNNITKCTLFIGLFLSMNVLAEQASSISGLTSKLDSAKAINTLTNKSVMQSQVKVEDGLTTDLTNVEKISTSELMITKNTVPKTRSLAERLQQINHYDYSFSIYQASTRLIDDYDVDGYYQTFSVNFDADILSYSILDQADVYAELYLSLNGGPWQHYLTTDVFTLYGESTNDDYSIHTRLNEGYVTGEYDVLIDLYEVGYSDIVATYSALDDTALIALPLESNEYDAVYVEQSHTDIHHYGGSTNWLIISLLMMVMVLRLQPLCFKSLIKTNVSK